MLAMLLTITISWYYYADSNRELFYLLESQNWCCEVEGARTLLAGSIKKPSTVGENKRRQRKTKLSDTETEPW